MKLVHFDIIDKITWQHVMGKVGLFGYEGLHETQLRHPFGHEAPSKEHLNVLFGYEEQYPAHLIHPFGYECPSKEHSNTLFGYEEQYPAHLIHPFGYECPSKEHLNALFGYEACLSMPSTYTYSFEN